MKISRCINVMQTELEQSGVDPAEARVQARWLAAHLLDRPLRELPLHLRDEIDIEIADPYLARLKQGEPLQYILGGTEFMGLPFACSPAALIPRGDSEALVEAAVELLREHPAPLILDLCCGNGAFGLSLAAYLPKSRVHLADISAPALELAEENRHKLRLTERTELFCGDLFAPLPAGSRYDLIISNPPYIPTAELAAYPLLAAEPRQALDGGPDGLDFYRRILTTAPDYLAENAYLLFEHGDTQSAALTALTETANLTLTAHLHDYAGRPRGILAVNRL